MKSYNKALFYYLMENLMFIIVKHNSCNRNEINFENLISNITAIIYQHIENHNEHIRNIDDTE